MFKGAYVSNRTARLADSDLPKKYQRIGGFFYKLARIDGFADPYSPPSYIFALFLHHLKILLLL